MYFKILMQGFRIAVFLIACLASTSAVGGENNKYDGMKSAELYESISKSKQQMRDITLRKSQIDDYNQQVQLIEERKEIWREIIKILKTLEKRNDVGLKNYLLDNLDLNSPNVAKPSVFIRPQHIIFLKYGEDLLVDAIVMERESKTSRLHGYWPFTIAGIIGQKNMASFCKDFLHERSAEYCIKFSDDSVFKKKYIERVYQDFLGKHYKVPNIDYPAFKKRFQKKLDAAMKKAKEEAQQPKAEKSDTKGEPARPFAENRKTDENNSPQNNTGNESGSLPWILGILALLAVAVGIGVARRKQG